LFNEKEVPIERIETSSAKENEGVMARANRSLSK